MAGYYGFTLDVHVSVRPSVVRPSVFRFKMITWVNINGFSPKSVCALILWRFDFGLLMGKFCLIFTELSCWETPIFSFPDNNLSKCQGSLTKFGICIWIKDILFGNANGQISTILTELSARDTIVAGYYRLRDFYKADNNGELKSQKKKNNRTTMRLVICILILNRLLYYQAWHDLYNPKNLELINPINTTWYLHSY